MCWKCLVLGGRDCIWVRNAREEGIILFGENLLPFVFRHWPAAC